MFTCTKCLLAHDELLAETLITLNQVMHIINIMAQEQGTLHPDTEGET